MIAECGQQFKYTLTFDMLLIPVLLQKEMKSIAVFSIFALVSTLVSIIMAVIL